MAAVPAMEGVAYSSDGSFKDVLGALRRQTPIIIITIMVCLALTIVIGLLVGPLYETQTMFYVEGRTQTSQTSYTPEDMPGLTDPQANYDVLTQIQRLTSLKVERETWERAGIPVPNQITEQALEQVPIAHAEQVNQSNAVLVKVIGPKSRDVLNFATELPTVFADDIKEQQETAIKAAKTFISSKVTDENATIKSLQDQLTALKAKSQVADTQVQASITATTLRDLQFQAAQAKANADGAAAVLAKVETEYKAIPDRIKNPQTVTNMSQKQQEEDQLSALQRQRAELLVTYTADSPQVKALDAQIAAQQTRASNVPKEIVVEKDDINPDKAEYKKLVTDARAKKDTADATYLSISQSLAARQAEEPKVTSSIDEQQRLEQQILDEQKSLSSLKDADLRIGLRENNIRNPLTVMSGAREPKQTRPDWSLYLPAAVLVGLILGSILAVARDNMHDRITNTDSAERITSVSLLASIPRRKRSGNPAIEAHHRAVSFEGYRILRTNLLLKLGDAEKRQVLFTSMVPGEGVSVVTANLATACAAAGHKTIYVDVNFRRPSGASLFGLASDTHGLADALSSNNSVQGYLSTTSTPGLEVLCAGTVPSNIGEALASPRMKQIIDELGTLADMVIYDASAFQGVADSVSLASAVGRVVVVVVPGVTPKQELKEFGEMMQLGKVDFMGIVMNKTEPSYQSDQYLS